MIKPFVLLVAMATGASAKWTGSAPTVQQASSSATCAAARGQTEQTWTTTSLVVTETTACVVNDFGVFQSIFDCDTGVLKSKQCTGGNVADWCSGTCAPINGDAFNTSGLIMELGDAASCIIKKNPTTKAVEFVEVVKSVTNTQGNYWGEMAKLCAKKAQGWVGAAPATFVQNATAKCDSSDLLNGAPYYTTSHMIVTKDTTCAMNEYGIYKHTFECTGNTTNTFKRKAGHTCTGGTFADPCSGSCTTPIPNEEDEVISKGDSSTDETCYFEKTGVGRITVSADVKGDYWAENLKLCPPPPDSPSSIDSASADDSESGATSAVLAHVTLTVVLSMMAVLLGSH